VTAVEARDRAGEPDEYVGGVAAPMQTTSVVVRLAYRVVWPGIGSFERCAVPYAGCT